MPKRIYDWKAIQAYHDQGHGFVACRRQFGVTHTAWNKAIKRGELRTAPRRFKDRRRRYDWAAVQAYYDEGRSFRECKEKFGFYAMSWHKACKRGELRPRPAGMPFTELLVERGGDRQNVKRRLLRNGLLDNRCSECGLTAWLGKPLSMHLDHVNGIRNDHRLENLRMLCPNCHSQTPTYGGRNMRRKPLQEGWEGV
jgi:5-methylcytosine-specific restriction endonuclease McrA